MSAVLNILVTTLFTTLIAVVVFQSGGVGKVLPQVTACGVSMVGYKSTAVRSGRHGNQAP